MLGSQGGAESPLKCKSLQTGVGPLLRTAPTVSPQRVGDKLPLQDLPSGLLTPGAWTPPPAPPLPARPQDSSPGDLDEGAPRRGVPCVGVTAICPPGFVGEGATGRAQGISSREGLLISVGSARVGTAGAVQGPAQGKWGLAPGGDGGLQHPGWERPGARAPVHLAARPGRGPGLRGIPALSSLRVTGSLSTSLCSCWGAAPSLRGSADPSPPAAAAPSGASGSLSARTPASLPLLPSSTGPSLWLPWTHPSLKTKQALGLSRPHLHGRCWRPSSNGTQGRLPPHRAHGDCGFAH